MIQKRPFLILLAALIVIAILMTYYLSSKGSNAPQLLLATASRKGIKLVVNTNGIIEPADRTEIYAPIDGFLKTIPHREGMDIPQGQLLMRLESEPIRTALAEARAALLDAKRQAQVVVAGPAKEEVSALDASIAEQTMRLNQIRKDLVIEESLLAKGATSRAAVENLQKERDLIELNTEALKQKRQHLMTRYSPQEKEWEQDKVRELSKQVDVLEEQLQMESIRAPKGGFLYSLPVKQGSYVSKGQLLAQIYRPGKLLLRAYVDEPDLGRIEKGQSTIIEWDGMPNQQWTGAVDKLATQVVALDNRSVGYVLCTIDGGPSGLIPNLNVRVEITTAVRTDALVVPRGAVFNYEGKPAVLIKEGIRTTIKPVETGLFTPEEIEILRGIDAGSSVVLNHAEVRAYVSH